jgi:hypothetical protein
MVGKLKKGFVYLLIAGWFLLLSALLMLAIDQALTLSHLYAASISAGPASDPSTVTGPRVGFWVYPLAAVVLASLPLLVARRHLRRLLLASALMLLAFAGLNLYSGRHLLPQLLAWPWPWPWPSALLQEYAQALAADDLEAALRLTDGSDQCRQAVTEVFSDHQSQLRQKLGADWQEAGLHASPHRSIMTYYEEPVPSRGILQPVPTQLVRLLVRRERGNLAWLVGLKVRYKPFLGARYFCGQGLDPEGWRFR